MVKLRQSTETKVAVVTGASSGFGEAIARRLLEDQERQWRVYGVARNIEKLDLLAGEVGIVPIECDITDTEQVRDAAELIKYESACVDLLVNNAGGGRKAVDDPEHEWEKIVGLNLLGTIDVIAKFRPLLEASRPSDIVTIASAAGTVPLPGSDAYTASKHGLVGAIRAMTPELQASGVNSHLILPGFANTESFPQDETTLPRLFRNGFFMTTPEEVADVVVQRVGKDSGEVFVPGIYRLLSILAATTPVLNAKITRKLFARYNPPA